MDWILGPLSRLICLVIGCAGWLPILIVAYIRWRLKGAPTNAKTN